MGIIFTKVQMVVKEYIHRMKNGLKKTYYLYN